MTKIVLLEHEEQSALFDWITIKAVGDFRYLNIFAVPNGILKNAAAHVKMVKEGFRAGLPDIFVDWPMGKWHGLRIEMKRKGGKLSDNQKDWLRRFSRAGYATAICFGFEEAQSCIERYFQLKPEVKLNDF